MKRPFLATAFAVLVLGGCVERRISITSDPPGALVRLNDAEVGRTPLSVGFEFYGDYDVAISKEGYEPLRVRQHARQPWYEYPPVDLAAMAVPVPFRTTLTWHYVLARSADAGTPEAERALIERGRSLRDDASK